MQTMLRTILVTTGILLLRSYAVTAKNSSCNVCCSRPITRHTLPQVCHTLFPPEITLPEQTSPSPFELNLDVGRHQTNFSLTRVSITATNETSFTEWIIFSQDVDVTKGKGNAYATFPGYWGTLDRIMHKAYICCDSRHRHMSMIYEFDYFKRPVGVNNTQRYQYYCECSYLKAMESRSIAFRAIVFESRSRYWVINKQITVTRPKRTYN